jgi:hypothetical protein
MCMLYRGSDRDLRTSQHMRSSDNRLHRDGQNNSRGEPLLNTSKESSTNLCEQDWDGVYSIAADKKSRQKAHIILL